jgi:hypothetical protein
MNTFKSAFYSLSAATLLTSSVFAADQIEVRLSEETSEIANTKDQLATKGGEIYLVKIGLDNDADFAKLTQVDFNITTASYRVDFNPKVDPTCTGEDNKIEEIDTSIIKNFVIYEGSVASINKVGTVPFATATHTDDGTQITASFKNSDVVFESGKDLDFTNTNSAATVYIIGLEYSEISQQVSKGEINIALDKVYVDDELVTSREAGLDAVADVQKTVNIDSVAPSPFHEYANTENGLAVDSYDAIIEQVENSTETDFFSMPQLDYLNTSTTATLDHTYVRHYNKVEIPAGSTTVTNALGDTSIDFGYTASVVYNLFNSYEGNNSYTATTVKEDVIGDDIRVIVRLDEELANDFCQIPMNSKYEENLSTEIVTNNLALINESFEFTDSQGNDLTGVTSFSCYTTCLSQKRLDPGEAKNLGDLNVSGTELHFTIDPTIATAEANTCDSANTIAVGDVTLSYNQGLLKDSFDNEVASFSGLAYQDNRAPVITGVEVDVETNTKGKIVFDEPINMNGNFTDIIKAGDSQDYNATGAEAYVATKTLNYDATNDQTIDFTASAELGDELYIRFTSGGITDKETNAVSIHHEGTFASNPLGVYVVPNRWNLISIPSCQATTSKRLSQSGTVQTIWGYDDNEWTKSPKKLEAGKGYWVKTLPINRDTYVNGDATAGDATDYDTAGTGYNSQIEDTTVYSAETNNIVTNFYNVQTTGYDAKYVDSQTVIDKNSDNTWKLLGIDEAISWSDAHSQVHSNCSTVSIFQYSPLGDSACATGNCGAWNAAPYIPSYSGVWVRQENCD